MAIASPEATSAQETLQASRVLSIQYLRAIAALMVVAYHAASRVEEDLPSFVTTNMDLGHAGVDLFFVISGFIIWTIGGTTTRSPGDFLVRRIVRIAPPYWFATLLWVSLVFILGANWASLEPSHVLRSLLFVPHWSPTFEDSFWPVLVPGWTLIFEAFFYLLFSVVLVFRQHRLAIVAAIIASLVLLGAVLNLSSAPMVAYTSPLLLEFLAGVLLAELCRHYRFDRVTAGLLIGTGILVIAVLGEFVTTNQTSWSRPLIFGLGSVLVVCGFVNLEDQMPRWRFLERLGDGSYATYLFHIPILVILLAVWDRMPWAGTSEGAWGYFAMGLGLSVIAGIWGFERIERPLQAGILAKLFPRKSRSR